MRKKHESIKLNMEEICCQQYKEIERKSVQIWDLEAEIAVLQKQAAEQEKIIAEQKVKIEELEKWCGYLQEWVDRLKKHAILYRIARKIKKIIFKR